MADRWDKFAACAEQPEELFFSPQNELLKIKQAKAICAECPVRFECLEEALEFDQPGVFGGATQNERDNIKLLLSATHVSLRVVWDSLHPKEATVTDIHAGKERISITLQFPSVRTLGA